MLTSGANLERAKDLPLGSKADYRALFILMFYQHLCSQYRNSRSCFSLLTIMSSRYGNIRTFGHIRR